MMGCDNCTRLRNDMKRLQRERDELQAIVDQLPKRYSHSDIARAKAEAYSSAADTACNQWNSLPRRRAWVRMTNGFNAIWENLKNISADHHAQAAEFAKEQGNNG